MPRTLARAVALTLIVVGTVFITSAFAFGRAHPIWDLVCITGQVLEADGTHTTFPTTCDQTGWKPIDD